MDCLLNILFCILFHSFYFAHISIKEYLTKYNSSELSLASSSSSSVDQLYSADPFVGENSSFCKQNRADVNFSDNICGHIIHDNTSFQFIGPDRDFVYINLVQKCIEVANVILGTGLPNYNMPCILSRVCTYKLGQSI